MVRRPHTKTYQVIKFELGSSAEESAAACPSKCSEFANSTTDLVGYATAMFANPTSDTCLCYFPPAGMPNPCPDSALKCETDCKNDAAVVSQYPVRATETDPSPHQVECYRYNAFDTFGSDTATRTSFNIH